MGKYSFDEKSATAEGGSGGQKVLDSGVYDVTIVTASQTIASTGTEGIDWSLQIEGSQYPNMVYGMWTFNKDGDRLFGMDIVQGLLGLLQAKDLTEYNKSIQVKGGTKTVVAYKEFDNVKCKVAVQKIKDFYNGEVTEKNEIKTFFSQDGKTYAEIRKGSDAKQINYYSNKLQDKETPKYKAHMLEADEPAEEAESSSLL